MKLKIIYIAIFFISITVFVSLVLGIAPSSAQEATEKETATKSAQETSETENAEPDETTLELKKRIEKVVEEKREQVKGAIEDLLSGKSGFIGEVFRVSEETITVTTPNGNVVVPIGESVQILKDGKDLMLEKVEVGNWVIVLGNTQAETVVPDYIFVEENSLRTPNQVVTLGTLQSINTKQVVITKRGTGEEKTLTILKTSQFEDQDGEEARITDFEEEISVLVTGFETEDGLELSTLRSLALLSDIKD